MTAFADALVPAQTEEIHKTAGRTHWPINLGYLAKYNVKRTFVDLSEDAGPVLGRPRTKSDPCVRYDSDAGSTRSADSAIDEAESFSDEACSQPAAAPAPHVLEPEPTPVAPVYSAMDAAAMGPATAVPPEAASSMMWVPMAMPSPNDGINPMWMMMPCTGAGIGAAAESEYQMLLMQQQYMQQQYYAQQVAAAMEGRAPPCPWQEQMQPPSPRLQTTPRQQQQAPQQPQSPPQQQQQQQQYAQQQAQKPAQKAQKQPAEEKQDVSATPAAPSGASPEEVSLAIAKARAPWRKGNRAQAREKAQQEQQVVAAQQQPVPKPVAAAAPADDRTTLMLRNLPNDLTRDMLIDLLETEGFARTFDFLYVPADFGRGAGLGYAFVNMVSNAEAMHMWRHLNGFMKWGMRSSKVLEVSWAAPLQGFAAYVERYRNSPVMHEKVLEQYKPLLFVDGRRRPMPAPTKPLRMPEPERRRAPQSSTSGGAARAA